MRYLVTGGAGFLGSHLCERLIAEGHEVLAYDSFLTGSAANVESLEKSSRFTLVDHNVTTPINVEGPLDWVLHLASPASPVDFPKHPIHILKVGALGTMNGLGLAKAKGAGFFLASTSEVYGDPLVHPQPEGYWGNVNPIGPRGVYDEAKRYAEAITYAYHRVHGLKVRVARIFNTYGTRMRQGDGRAVPNFISQALSGLPISVHGDGSQTRSLCYVTDLIEGFVRLLASDVSDPVNLGNPRESTVEEIAQTIRSIARSSSDVIHIERPIDDPERRCPDISRAKALLGWTPKVDLEEGLATTIEWCERNWSSSPQTV